MRRTLLFLTVVLTLGLGGGVLAASAGVDQELIVSAAASLTNAFGEIGKSFENAHPGTKVIFNFAASGPLLLQIEQGAPVDVFAAADQKTMDQAHEKQLIVPDTRRDFTSNELVLIVPLASKIDLKGSKDLIRPEVARIALGNPDSVPAGRYAAEALNMEGLWETLKPRFIFGNSVRQVLDYVSRGEVDAGFVFASDAVIAADKVRVITKVETHQPIRYPIAMVATTSKRELAQSFIDWVGSTAGRKILERYGFGKP
jgi:molybdate transport system substrate-binding protein